MSLQMSVEKATSVPTDVGSKSYIYQTDRCRFSEFDALSACNGSCQYYTGTGLLVKVQRRSK